MDAKEIEENILEYHEFSKSRKEISCSLLKCPH